MLEDAGSRLVWYISDFIWLLCVCLVSQSFCVWKLREHLKVVSCVGDCYALLKGFRMLFWAHVSGVQSYISVGKVNLVRWCRLNADRGDCLCDRQVVGFDSVCKLQWDDFFERFYFLRTSSYVMAQMWRDRMLYGYVLGVSLMKRASVYVIWVSLCFY